MGRDWGEGRGGGGKVIAWGLPKSSKGQAESSLMLRLAIRCGFGLVFFFSCFFLEIGFGLRVAALFSRGQTAIHLAAYKGHLTCLDALIKAKADKAGCDARDVSEKGPTDCAIRTSLRAGHARQKRPGLQALG